MLIPFPLPACEQYQCWGLSIWRVRHVTGEAGRSGELAAVIVRVHSQELLVDLVADPGATHPVSNMASCIPPPS